MSRGAAYFRHHRQCFALAMEMGVTPREAALELARRETKARSEKAMERFRREEAIARAAQPQPIDDSRWMMRN